MRISGLAGNVTDLLKRVGEDTSKIGRYFHWDSEFFRALKEHLWKADPCLVEKPVDEDGKELEISVCSGTGPAVAFRKAWTYSTQFKGNEPYEPDYYVLEVLATFDDGDVGTVDRPYNFKVPFDLENNFTQEKFDAWVGEQLKAKQDKRRQQEIPLLKKLMAKYPDEVQKLLESIEN